MCKISEEIINFIEKTMNTWKAELTAGGRSFAEAKVQKVIFQIDTLSPLIFIIAMMPLKNEKEIETLIHAVRIHSQDIGIEYDIKTCHTSNEKWQMTPDGWNGIAKTRQD